MTSPGKVNGICLDRLDQNRAIIRTIQVIQASTQITFPLQLGTPVLNLAGIDVTLIGSSRRRPSSSPHDSAGAG